MLEAGLTGEQKVVVTQENTAKVYGSGELEVFATPAMIALMEKTCLMSVADSLNDGEGTVGTKIEVSHVAATPVGMEVRCESVLKEVDRRRLVFEVKAYDAAGLIGEGIHERFVIANEPFMAKANGKLK